MDEIGRRCRHLEAALNMRGGYKDKVNKSK